MLALTAVHRSLADGGFVCEVPIEYFLAECR
jgi:hypothetical protein